MRNVLAVLADAALTVKHWATIAELDSGRDRDQNGAHEDEQHEASGAVEERFHQPPASASTRAHKSPRAGVPRPGSPRCVDRRCPPDPGPRANQYPNPAVTRRASATRARGNVRFRRRRWCQHRHVARRRRVCRHQGARRTTGRSPRCRPERTLRVYCARRRWRVGPFLQSRRRRQHGAARHRGRIASEEFARASHRASRVSAVATGMVIATNTREKSAWRTNETNATMPRTHIAELATRRNCSAPAAR